MSIAENVKKIRKQNGITQEKLAEGTGYSRSMIARIECGNLIPNVLDERNRRLLRRTY